MCAVFICYVHLLHSFATFFYSLQFTHFILFTAALVVIMLVVIIVFVYNNFFVDIIVCFSKTILTFLVAF